MSSSYTAPLLAWYSRNARDLPWRRATGPAAAWSVLVSEIMLQQTPVARVLPVHGLWLERWPTPAALASAAPGDAIREWGRLGYPRRALRLHAAAGAIVERHGGQVPSSVASLLELPGVGTYTAAAVAAFAFCQREAVLDTNVRRVLARLVGGTAGPVSASGAPAGSGLSVAEVRLATSLLPSDPAVAARWSVAVMELGALVCTAATSPACEACPLAGQCAWLAAGRPAGAGKRPAQRDEGTDRQCRGRGVAGLRSSLAPVGRADFDVVWTSPVQLERALDGLVSDGLVDPLPDGRFALPGTAG